MIRSIAAKLIGANRPKIVAVLAANRRELELAVAHAKAGADIALWAWCTESLEPDNVPAGCEYCLSGANALADFTDKRTRVWIALAVVCWTRRGPSLALKLLPFLVPPFRVLVMNEVGDFFPATPGSVAVHVRRRCRESLVAAAELGSDWLRATGPLTRSLAIRTAERIRDISGLARSFAIRSAERARDAILLAHSFLYRSAQKFRDAIALGYSLTLRTGQRLRDLLALGWSYTWRGWETVRDLAVLARELFLAALAWCAQPVNPAVFRAMEGLPAGDLPETRRLSQTAADTVVVVEVAITGRAWPRRAVKRALLTHSADFIVFRQTAEAGDTASLITMALRTGSFAAAKQSAHSAWRRYAAKKHPFRMLQEGEIAQVFAPWSSLTVIRRKTMLELGCPRAFTTGAAMMLLFAKATAAGYRSIAVGHSGTVTDEPAMPLEDLEFAARVLFSPALRRTWPSQDLLRGNIAHSPAHKRRPARTPRPRILVVSPYLPFPLAHGGAVRIYNLCRELSSQVDFTLVCFREAGETVHYGELHRVFREVLVVDADEKHHDVTVPAQVAEYRNTAMQRLVSSLCERDAIDLVQLEYTQLAEYRSFTGSVPVVLVEHDITFTLHRQLADLTREIAARREYQRWLEFESEALAAHDSVWAMSGFDAETAEQHGASASRMAVVPNGVDLRRFEPVPAPEGRPTVLFVGSFRHHPNLLAFEALREAIMPEVWRSCPQAVLHVIAGPNHERAAELAGLSALLAPDPRIVLEGFVEDVRPAYRNADVVAIPLPISAGTNIKLMEAMACARAVVSTPAGCRGLDLIDGRELLVSELEHGFAESIVALLKDPSLRWRMGREGRKTAERRFGWNSIAREALKSYKALLEPAVSQPVPRAISIGSADRARFGS